MNNKLKITIRLDNIIYGIDTGLEDKWNFKCGTNYYLADDYKEPTIVHFIDWNISQSVDNIINMFCAVMNLSKKQIEYYNPSSLFKTKSQAQDYYLRNKEMIIK